MDITAYPQKFNNEVIAREVALSASTQDKNWFYHVVSNNSGGFVVDTQGVVYSDEQHVATYHKGKIELERSNQNIKAP